MAKRAILHATDFSTASRPAFAKAIELSKADRSPLLVLHVLNPMVPMIGDRAIEPPTFAQLQKASRATALKQLARLTARAKARGVKAKAILVDGSEAGTIVRVARSRRVAMIVIGTHGRSGLERALLGSVATRVVSLATCPVLTVRGR
jgi:nucleotide-binding universal stress UspA family protein